jgi:small subunit ribosomal protein S18
MARNTDRDRKRPTKDTRSRGKKKVCLFCKEHTDWVDYKDVNLLRRFMSDRGKVRARRVTGNCAQHQREVATAIKTARELALLPYTERTVSERGPGRGSPRATEARAGVADFEREASEGADLAGREDFEAAELENVGAEV